VEVSGRVKGEGPRTRATWAVVVHKTSATADHRGFAVKINGKGELFVTPSPFPEASHFLNVDPTIGPITHPAIKPGDEFNALVLVIRKRSLEILVNSVRVCEPVSFDYDLTQSAFDLGTFDGTKTSRAEFERIEVRELWDDHRPPPTSFNFLRTATRPVYIDDFNDPSSGWTKGESSGYSGGLYLINPRENQTACKCPALVWRDCVVEVVGRIHSVEPGTRGAWGVVLNKEVGTARRGFAVLINGKGELKVGPNPWTSATEFRELDPTIGPIVHPAIKPANQANTLVLVVRRRSLELFVNSARICGPVPYDFDLTSAYVQLGAFNGPGNHQAEFDKISIRDFVRPEREKR
jgi:hypothetical protein